jgi:GTP cyclohydrolase II
MLRSLGVDLHGPTLMLGDNMSVVLNTSVPSSVLKKKHNAIAYHRVREAIAAKVMRFAYVKSEENVSDILTRTGCSVFLRLRNEIQFMKKKKREKKGLYICLRK